MSSADRCNLKVAQTEAGVAVQLIDCRLLNETTTPGIETQLLGLAGEMPSARMALDLSGVQYASSIALAMCLALHHKLRDGGGHLRVHGLSADLYEIFDVTGLTRVIDIERPT